MSSTPSTASPLAPPQPEIAARLTRRREFWNGVKLTFPLAVGATPFAIIFGAVAVNSGLSSAGAIAMSALVFAGSAQFIATGLIKAGATVAVIVLTTFVVNLRHVLYSATLAPHMKHLPQRWLAPLAFWLTDESFVVVIARYNEPDDSPHKHWFFFGSALFMYSNWQLWTIIGVFAGSHIPDASRWGLDFAMVVTFIGMLVPLVRSRAVLVCVVVAGITAVIAQLLLRQFGLPTQLGLIIAALLGVASGVIVDRLDSRTKSAETESQP